MKALSNLKPAQKKKSRKRVGRGPGSGTGTYSGRGLKGQKARSGGNIKPGFEGGRMPLIRQVPKNRGFRSIYPKSQPVSLTQLDNAFATGAEVTPAVLAKKGLVESAKLPVKILGKGKLAKKLSINGIKVSKSAKVEIEKAGGTVKQKDEKNPTNLETERST